MPPALTQAHITHWSCPLRTALIHLLPSLFHTRMVWSMDRDATRVPFLLSQTYHAVLLCPSITALTHSPPPFSDPQWCYPTVWRSMSRYSLQKYSLRGAVASVEHAIGPLLPSLCHTGTVPSWDSEAALVPPPLVETVIMLSLCAVRTALTRSCPSFFTTRKGMVP